MNWNDWEMVWRRQDLPAGAQADLTALKQTFDASHRKMRRALLIRDCSEILAAVFVAVVFALQGWHLGRSGWPFLFAVVLVLAVAAVFLRERLRQRRARLGPDASVSEKIDADLTELRHQRRMLGNVFAWYIGPIFAAELIVLATIWHRSKPWELQREPVFLAAVVLFLALVNFWAFTINRRAVRRQIDPRIAELEKLRSDLAG